MDKVFIKTVIENYDRIETTVKEHKGTAIVTTIAVGASILGYKFYKNWCKSHFRQKEETHKSKMRREEQAHNYDLRDKEAVRKFNHKMKEMSFAFELKTKLYDYKKNVNEKREEVEEAEINKMAESEPIESINDVLSTPCEEEKNLVGPIFPYGGITLLAGEKGLGKTSLITQALFQLSGSKEHELFPETKIDNIQQVVYFDYELTKEQFKNRYKNIPFKNIKFIWDSVREGSSSYLIKRINKILSEKKGHTTIVIDNLTKIRDLNSPKNCRNFYTELENIRTEYKKKNIIVSFIIVAHVILKKPKYKPVDLEDIQTSSRFINFADSIIVIGRTRFKETVLLKVCKNRNGKESNGSAYVFKKEESDFLHYEYQGEYAESDVLPTKDGILKSISTIKENTQVNSEENISVGKSKTVGRKPKLSKEDVIQMLYLRSQGMSKGAVSRKYGVERQGYNQAVKRYGLVDNYN